MASIYTLKNLEIRLDKNFCLQIPDLEIPQGTIKSIIGPNGAGKSTLLKALALLLKPQRGSLTFSGHTLSAENYNPQNLRRRVTLVDQSPYLLQGTIYKNLAYGLKVRGIPRNEQAVRIQKALSDVGLTYSQRRLVRDLSGGEKQRVALARALVLQPEVLLLDEPTANIDHASQPHFEQLLKRLADNGMTILLSTHAPEQAQRLGNSAIRVNEGIVTD
jgi:tungstate transport system ATP-binding protein